MSEAALPTVHIPDHALYQDLGSEIVLLNLQTEEYFGLEGTAQRIWQLATEHGGNLEAVIEQMTREFEVDAARLRADMHVLIEQLAAAGLVEVK